MKSCHCQGHRRTGRPLPSSSKTGGMFLLPWGPWMASTYPSGNHTTQAVCFTTAAIRKPHNSGSVFCNYKGFFSVVLLALVGADYKFIRIDTGGEGHQSKSDGELFGDSELKECIDDNTIHFPDSDPLPNDDRDTPYYILGDDAFPLSTFLMKPYGRRGLDNDMMVANYRISRGKRVLENAFAILANRWRCFLGTLEQGPDVVRLLVETGVILHNLLRIRLPAIANAEVDQEDEDHNIIPGAWRETNRWRRYPSPGTQQRQSCGQSDK